MPVENWGFSVEKEPSKIPAPPQESVPADAGQPALVASQSFNIVIPLAPVECPSQAWRLAEPDYGPSPHIHTPYGDYESESKD